MDIQQGNSKVPIEVEVAAGEYYPPPPFYFSHFDSPDVFKPPRLECIQSLKDSSNTTTISSILNTIFPNTFINNYLNDIAKLASAGCDNTSIRQDLCRIVDDILKISLSMISTFPPSPHISVDDMYMKLDSLVTEFYSKLASYREHEATELLNREMKAQLLEAKAVRDKMKILLEKYSGNL